VDQLESSMILRQAQVSHSHSDLDPLECVPSYYFSSQDEASSTKSWLLHGGESGQSLDFIHMYVKN